MSAPSPLLRRNTRHRAARKARRGGRVTMEAKQGHVFKLSAWKTPDWLKSKKQRATDAKQ